MVSEVGKEERLPSEGEALVVMKSSPCAHLDLSASSGSNDFSLLKLLLMTLNSPNFSF